VSAVQPSRETSISRLFHEETKYIAGDMGRFSRPAGQPPAPFKHYQADQAVDLVAFLPFSRHPFTGREMPEIPSGSEDSSLRELSRLLYFSNGVTAVMPYPDGSRQTLRAAPSAGALYPTEMYVAVRNMPPLADGVYHYLAQSHVLVPVWESNPWERLEPALCGHGAVAQADLVLLLTGLWGRSTWRYRERAYRRILLDTGHVLGNVVLTAPEYGFGAFPIGGFVDHAMSNLLFLGDEEEALLCAVALPRLDAVDLSRIPTAGVLPSGTVVGTADPDTLLLQVHRGGNIERPAEFPQASRPNASGPDAFRPELSRLDPKAIETLWAGAHDTIALDHEPVTFPGGLEQSLLRRRSTRSYSASSPCTLEQLGTILSFAGQVAVPFGDSGPGAALRHAFDPTLLETYLLVNAVEDTDPGLFYYAPGAHELRRMRGGDLRAAATHVCLGQELSRDAAVLIIHTFNLDRAVERYGDRAYRYAHLDAGHIGERLNLAALAIGLGASGIGGFYDNDIARLLDLPPETAVAYITTIGVPDARV